MKGCLNTPMRPEEPPVGVFPCVQSIGAILIVAAAGRRIVKKVHQRPSAPLRLDVLASPTAAAALAHVDSLGDSDESTRAYGDEVRAGWHETAGLAGRGGGFTDLSCMAAILLLATVYSCYTSGG